ncbi:uncharacterized protein LOC117176812 isoform X2 [Belonocnema kinseyi]|uniref:uncharacterized protein LOC117176812 isoform X2 n=1 Tax=Belonocnema kinseyi TaxID=2817044 RepID=UPI00143DC492|nr:uncharacterized protein LOC117176812 isoform X2 [Belonocnema kinseyi]
MDRVGENENYRKVRFRAWLAVTFNINPGNPNVNIQGREPFLLDLNTCYCWSHLTDHHRSFTLTVSASTKYRGLKL